MSLKQEAAHELYYPKENSLVAKKEGKQLTLTSSRTSALSIKQESQDVLHKQKSTKKVVG